MGSLHVCMLALSTSVMASCASTMSARINMVVIRPSSTRARADGAAAEGRAQQQILEHGPGTAFLFAAGVHEVGMLAPLDGQTLRGELGATLHGQVSRLP